MKKQLIFILLILAAAMYALARPGDTGGRSTPGDTGASLQDAYKGMMQLVPFTFSRQEAAPPKPLS